MGKDKKPTKQTNQKPKQKPPPQLDVSFSIELIKIRFLLHFSQRSSGLVWVKTSNGNNIIP